MNNVFFQTGLKNQDSLKVCLVGQFGKGNTSLSLSLSLSLSIYIYINENASYNLFGYMIYKELCSYKTSKKCIIYSHYQATCFKMQI